MENLHEAINSGNILHSAFISQINQRDADGNTPLCSAIKKIIEIDEATDEIFIRRDYYFIVNLLIQNGADVNLSDAEGNTPLWLAIQVADKDEQEKDAFSLIKNLVSKGVELSYQDAEGNTALHRAANAREVPFKLLQCLIQSKPNDQVIDINKKNDEGNTVLHLAASDSMFNREIMALLLEYGADADIQNNKGKTAKDIADSVNTKRASYVYILKNINHEQISSESEPLENKFQQSGAAEFSSRQNVQLDVHPELKRKREGEDSDDTVSFNS